MYRISYKHDVHGSDSIGCNFATVEAAEREIIVIQNNPGDGGYADWLRDAALWISDDKGNIYS